VCDAAWSSRMFLAVFPHEAEHRRDVA
jgi:hypothetical protein